MSADNSLQAKWADDVAKVQKALDTLGLTIGQRGISQRIAATTGLSLRATQRALRALTPR